MTRTVLTDWTADKAQRFGKAVLEFQHTLAEEPLFNDEGLARLLHTYPRDKLGVFTMGDDSQDVKSWRRGSAGSLSGDRLLAEAQAGRVWVNLRHANAHDTECDRLCQAMFADVEAGSGQKTFKQDFGVLISSPNIQVLYHFDVPLVMLWQMRGEKTVRAWQPKPPFVDNILFESVVLKEQEEEIPFNPDWDQDAATVTLTPGKMLTWPQNGPHRITNGPMMNVSVSTEFMTPTALWRANVLYANGVLRRRHGLKPDIDARNLPLEALKVAYARLVKATGGWKGKEYDTTPTFDLEKPDSKVA
ncbi:MAG: hypothetical protein ACK41P_00235 [Asticcacaulis sp.]